MHDSDVQKARKGWLRPSRLLAGLLAFLLVGGLAYKYRQPITDALHPAKVWDTSEFGLPITLSDGRTGVFTYSRRFYRLEGGGVFPFSGGRQNYFVDVKTIGTYDLQTGNVKILQKKTHERHGDGKGDYVLHSASRDSVLVVEESTRQVDYESKGKYYLLNIPTNRFTELPLDQEHIENSVAADYRYLVKPDGTMVFTQGNPGGYGRMWIRLADGTYVHLGTNVQYSGFRDDRAFFTQHVPERASLCKAYDIQTRAVLDVDCQEIQKLVRLRWDEEENRPVVLCWEADKKSLYIARRKGNNSAKEPIQIPESLLK